jgi:RNA polymerase sigma factor (sigma-70 family)
VQPPDDNALLRQYVEGQSDEAFSELVTRHINLVYSVALRSIGNRHEAEDVAHTVFILLSKKAAQLRHEKALSSWLFQATRLTASNYVRSEIRRRRREHEAHMQWTLNEPEGDLWPRIAPLLDDAVAELNEKDRRAIVLRFYQGKNLREVGAALGSSEDAAEKRVSRAIAKLRTYFAKCGVTVGESGLIGVISANAAPAAPMGLAVTISAAVALGETAIVATATATTAKTIAMASLQKTLIATLLATAVGVGIYEARQAAALRTRLRLLGQGQSSSDEIRRGTTAQQPPQPSTNSPLKRFDWGSVESTDYKQYLANLRSAGWPEETIRNLIRADVSRLYEGKKRELRKAAPRFEYWKGDDFIRTGAGREAWIRMLAINEERDATMRALGVEPELGKQDAKNATAMDWMLDYLGDENKALVLRLNRELEDKLTMRERGSLDPTQMEQLAKDRDDAVKRSLTPELAFQYDLRQPTGTGGRVRQNLAFFDANEDEFVAVFKIRKGFEQQYPDLFPEVQTVNPAELTAAQRRAMRETTQQVEAQIQEQIRTALGPKRSADYELAQNPNYQEMYRVAEQAGLGVAESKQLYQARLGAEEQADLLRNDPGLSPGKRGSALTGLRQNTENYIQRVLGDKAWEQFGRIGTKPWLDHIGQLPEPGIDAPPVSGSVKKGAP